MKWNKFPSKDDTVSQTMIIFICNISGGFIYKENVQNKSKFLKDLKSLNCVASI